MKKTLTAAALSSLMVLGLATSALAIHTTDTAEEPMVTKGPSKITVDGNVRMRGAYDKNDTTENAAGNSYYDTRVQLGVNAKVSDQASGYVRLESGHGTSDVYTWGKDENGNPWNGGNLFSGGGKTGDLTILEAWVNYNPGDWGVKAGHMPLALGNKVFFDHTGSGDDAIVVYGSFGEATHVAALTIKFDEQRNNDGSDDLDGYVALITHKLSDSLNLGANWTYLRGGSDGQFSVPAVAGVAATPGNVGVAAVAAGPEFMPGMSMSNIGLTADGKVGAIDYMADLEFQFGTVMDIDHVGSADANGWAGKVGANYDLGMGKVGLLFGYGSGDDANDNDNDVDAFINFLTDTTYDTIIAGYRAAIRGGGPGFYPKNTGLSNLTLYQLNGSTKTVCPLTGKDLSLFGSLSYMQLSEDIYNYGTHRADNVGTELDLIATWALTAGLNYKVEAAYLWAGDVYETAKNGAGSNPDDLAFIRHSLDLKF